MEEAFISNIRAYVAEHISEFHDARLTRLDKLKLKDVLARKNPYLFRAKHLETAEAIVQPLVDAHLSSGEETIFGDWLERLAIHVCALKFGGFKSSAPGIDLEFHKDSCHYLVSIKSGPHWGNNSQIKKMMADFISAMKTLKTSGGNTHVPIIAVNGCCYGKDNVPFKGNYYKYCGQDFWEFISGEASLYVDLIEPLAEQAKERNEEFMERYHCKINVFVREFLELFCNEDGSINWEQIVRFNSGRK